MKKLFLIGGASGSGKSAICKTLVGKIRGVICLDGDILWNPNVFNMENTVAFYDVWFDLANEISQNNVAVAIFHAGLGFPENLTEKAQKMFDVHYLTLYCSDEELEKRLLARPEWKHNVERAVEFVNAMKGMNMKYKHLAINDKIDTSDAMLEESAMQVRKWIEVN